MPIHKYLLYLIVPAILAVAFFVIKEKDDQAAFNSCVDKSESLRLAIIDFKKTNTDFPNSLKQLDPNLICGQRWLREPLVRYEKLDGDFILSFSDRFVTFKGSAEEPMTAFK